MYTFLLFAVSWKALQLQKQSEATGAVAYLLAGRNLPSSLVAVMLAGLAIGGASTVGVAQNAYTRGLSAGWYNAAWGTAGIAVGLVAASYFRRINVRTVPEMMGRMFGPGARVLGAIAQLVIQMVITSLQYVAGGAILTALLPQVFSFQSGMMATAIIFIGVTLVGGYLAGGLVNLINVAVIYIGIIAALFSTSQAMGGVSSVLASLPSNGVWLNWTSGMGIAIIAAWMAVMITQAFSVQAVNQIAFAARDERSARRGFLLGGVMILPVGFLCALFGVMAASRFPGLENSAMALPSLVTSISPAIGGLLLAGLWAADISTAVGLLLGSATLTLEDMIKPLFYRGQELSPKQELLLSRLCVVLVSLLTFFLALSVVGILKTLTSALAVTASFTLLILADIFVPSLCRRGSGFWTILASLVVWVLWTFIPAFRVASHIIYLEWPICVVVFMLVALMDHRPAVRLVQFS
ncbi:MAG: symporter [Dethiosulfovibrio peptidovorans]|nr:MAG: symporter [Dethiosulfovibrio peptidovorans]